MYSKEHINYLKKERKKNLTIRFFQIIIIFQFIIIWQILADTRLINTFITSSPKSIINTLISLSHEDLFEHIFITVYETLFSFSLGTIIGLVIAAILWWNNYLYKIFDPYLTILNSLPKVALGPIIIIWCGSGMKSIILMALLISVIITIINISTSFKEVDSNKIKLFKSLKASKSQLFFKLILPDSLKSIISSLKINISMSLIGLLPPVGEKTFFNKCYSRY